MSDQSTEQRSSRYPIQLPLLFKPSAPAPIRVGVGWTLNLAENGACVELSERLPPQTSLHVRLRTEHGPIDLDAEVIWAGEPLSPGGGIPHGLTFTRIAPEQDQALRNLLLPFQFVHHAGVRLPFTASVTCQRKDKGGPPFRGSTGNISRTGLLLLLPQTLDFGLKLDITLHTPKAPITVEGVIVWVDPPENRSPEGPIKHGVRFTSLTWSISLALGLLLAGPA